MSRRWILIALATVTAVLGVACGGGDTGGSTTGPSATSAEPQPGGTLHIALISDVQDAFDPAEGILVGHVGVLPVLSAQDVALL